jgi:protein subunit release factor A
MTGGGKLSDIKETASDAVEIMRELGTPGVQETFDNIREVAITAKEIMEIMKAPEWQRNMENIRMISQNFNQASERMDNTTKELKETGVIDDAKELIKTAKEKIGSFGGTEGGGGGMGLQDLKEMTTAVKEMLESIKGLVDELKVTVAESKRSGTMHNIEQTTRELSDTYRTVKRDIER